MHRWTCPASPPPPKPRLIDRLRDGSFDAWADTAAEVGYCTNPVRLVGGSTTIDARTGRGPRLVLAPATAPLGVVYRACGNRRADVCPPCSRTYARDTFAMIRAGLVGGKTVPDTVADNPLLFVDLHRPLVRPRPRTPPQHGQPHRRPLPPPRQVAAVPARPPDRLHEDPRRGRPDQRRAAVRGLLRLGVRGRVAVVGTRAVATHHHRAPPRASPPRSGSRNGGSRRSPRCSTPRSAEYQARGLIHFHALIRLDGPDGPGSPAPWTATTWPTLARGGRTARSPTPRPPSTTDDTDRVLAWGKQLDVRVVRDGHRTDDPDGPLTAGAGRRLPREVRHQGRQQPPHARRAPSRT